MPDKADLVEEPINRIDIAEFHALGFLQEVNRQFLHPLGLALEVRQGLTRERVAEVLNGNGVRFGEDAIDNCMAIVKILGLDQAHLGGVWDYRDDIEGIVFGDPVDSTKVDAVAAEQDRHAAARHDMFGSVVQPAEGTRGPGVFYAFDLNLPDHAEPTQ